MATEGIRPLVASQIFFIRANLRNGRQKCFATSTLSAQNAPYMGGNQEYYVPGDKNSTLNVTFNTLCNALSGLQHDNSQTGDTTQNMNHPIA